MRARYKDAFKEGKIKGDLADVARIGESFKPLPQSGTTPRAFYSGLAGGALFADPMTSAAIMAGPPAAQAAADASLAAAGLVVWAVKPQLFAEAAAPCKAHVGGALAGAALNVGTYSVGPVGGGATYTFDYPTTTKALSIVMMVKWAAAADASYAQLSPIGGSGGPTVISQVANIRSSVAGNVSLDSSAKFNIVIGNANSTYFYFYVTGYFI
jgi:hypothetical protein